MGIGLTDQIVPLGSFPIVEDTDTKGGYQSVTNLAARDAISAARRKEGLTVWAYSSKSLWRLQSDLVTWIRVPTLIPEYLTQPVWYIDSVAGNDENSGADAGHPIKTHAEFKARVVYGPINTIVNIVGDLPRTDPLDLSFQTTPDGVVYQGTTTIVGGGSFATSTARSGNNTRNQGTSLAFPNWSEALNFGAYVKITSGSAVNSIAYVLIDAAGTATFSQWFNPSTYEENQPAPGDNFVVIQCSQIHKINTFVGAGNWYLFDLALGEKGDYSYTTNFRGTNNSSVTFTRCGLSYPGMSYIESWIDFSNVVNCYYRGGVNAVYGSAFTRDDVLGYGSVAAVGRCSLSLNNITAEGVAFEIEDAGNMSVIDSSIFNSRAGDGPSALALNSSAVMYVHNVDGNGNQNYGIIISGGCKLNVTSPMILTGVSGDIRVDGATRAWSDGAYFGSKSGAEIFTDMGV